MCVCVIVLNKQKSLGFSNSTRSRIIIITIIITFMFNHLHSIISMRTNTNPYTHTPMRVNEIHIHTKAVHWWQYDLNTSMVHMHVNVPWQCWHSDTVPSMQLCIPILTSVLSLPHACVCVSLRVCMRSIPADYFASIFIHYTYITISLVFEYIWSDYNHLCTQAIYTYRRTTRTHSANTFTHYTNESTSNNIGNNNREEKREKYKYKCWKYRTHKRIHTLTGLVGWLISNMYIQ